jgi:predicted aspartyl protease
MMRWLLIALIGLLIAPVPVTAQVQRDPVLLASNFSFVPEARRAEVGYTTVKGRVVFRARLGEREVWALLDNGADRTLIDLETARSMGLKLDSAKGEVFGAGGGSLTSQWVANVPVSIPGQFEAHMPMLGLDMRAASKILGHRIELVIGGDALMFMALRIDPFARRFHFTHSGRMDGVAGHAPIRLRGKRALLEVRIENKPVTVGIDLGSNGGLTLTEEAWDQLGLKAQHLGTGSARGATGEPYDVEVFRLDAIRIGKHEIEDVNVSLEPARLGTGDGIVGMDVLGKIIIVMDLGAGKLWLIEPDAPPT